MATGLTPGQHGIVVNSFFDPGARAMFLRTSATDGRGSAANQSGSPQSAPAFKTAAYFWTGSEAEIRGVRPTYWHPFDATRPDRPEDRPRS